MSAAEAAGYAFAAVMAGLIILTTAAGLVWVIDYCRDYAYWRKREQQLADAWCATHRAHVHDDRHTHDTEGRPE